MNAGLYTGNFVHQVDFAADVEADCYEDVAAYISAAVDVRADYNRKLIIIAPKK